jgi:undecaprenyl-diphosphatase
MLSTLIEWDKSGFYLINTVLTNPFFDWLLPIFREKTIWIPLYISFFVYSFLKMNWQKAILVVLFSLLTVGISDTISSKIIKKNVERPRPCRTEEKVRSLVVCGTGYSFTSSHATNHFAIAIFAMGVLAHALKRWKWCLPLWAASIGYAQIYVGVHYPLDVLAGALVGVLVGRFIFRLYLYTNRKLFIPQSMNA